MAPIVRRRIDTERQFPGGIPIQKLMSIQAPPVLEKALLDIVSVGNGSHTLHSIGVELSNRSVPRQPDMLKALKELAERGLLVRTMVPGTSGDAWCITEAGRHRLVALATGEG